MSGTIGIIGGGAWGTALAQVYAAAGNDVALWAREADVVAAVNAQHENTVFLPGVTLDKRVHACADMAEAAEPDIILIVTPAQHVRAALKTLRPALAQQKKLVICAKGIEIATGKLMSQVAAEEAPKAVTAVLTGPTFAGEIARGLPSAVTIATNDKNAAQEIRDALASKTLRPYVSDDITGAQIGGAVKNVIAIACGIVAGRGLGDSARAALMTRGLAEMARLSIAMGGKKETLMGMCGVGDLMLTCSSMQSRNYSLGVRIGQGETLQKIMGGRNSVAEGIHTAHALIAMAEQHAFDMPVAAAVYECLHDGLSIGATIDRMMDRPLRSENA